MSRYNDELKLKLAWQSAYEERTCPPAEILHADTLDENLRQHLAICATCREDREMSRDEQDAWRGLFDRMAGGVLASVDATKKKAGQIWTMKKSLGGWQVDGRYFSPPVVMLLSKENASSWAAAQLFGEKRLAGSGDVLLDDRFGFAEGWNCYPVRQDILECCLGSATDEQVAEVMRAKGMAPAPLSEDSILWFFREEEKAVRVTLSLAQELKRSAATQSHNETVLQKLFGGLAEAYDNLSKFKLPEYADSLLDLLSGASDPHGISPVIAATSIPLQVNIVIKQMDGAITIKTVGATLTESNWEDGDYYIAGKLMEVPQEDLFLVASLNLNGHVVCECQGHIEKESPYFDILFKSVAEEASSIENLKFILVKP